MEEAADDYKQAHSAVEPPVEWDGAGSWFNLMGESLNGKSA